MFKYLTPQKVRHSLGYVVQIADRTTVEYLDQDQRAFIEADFGSTVGIYEKSFRLFEDGKEIFISSKKELILDRIVAGLKAMDDSKVEIC